MNGIRVKSPMPRDQIDKLVLKIGTEKSIVMDGSVLANLIRICFECAFKRNELIDLTIEDVSEGKVIKDIIRVGDQNYKITDSAKIILQEHLCLLKLRNYKLYASRPLFPSKKGHKYSEKNLANHLKKYFDKEPNEISLENIRQAGICNYYSEVRKRMTEEESLKCSLKFARTKSFRHIKRLLMGQIQAAGKKPYRFSDYLKEIELLSFTAQRDGVRIDKIKEKDLQKRIIKDAKLKKTQREELLIDLIKEVNKSKLNTARIIMKQEDKCKSVTDFIRGSFKSKK